MSDCSVKQNKSPNSLLCSRRLKSRNRCRNIHLGHMIPPPQVLKVNSLRVFSLGFVIAGRSFLPVGMEKGQSIFSAALVGGYSILVCCFQIYKIACCSAIAIFSIPFSCYFINISAQFKSEYVSNNSYIFAVCSRLSPMFVTPALHT